MRKATRVPLCTSRIACADRENTGDSRMGHAGSSKPLIVSVHGPPGVGKSLTHMLAAKALYNSHPLSTTQCPGRSCAGYKVRCSCPNVITAMLTATSIPCFPFQNHSLIKKQPGQNRSAKGRSPMRKPACGSHAASPSEICMLQLCKLQSHNTLQLVIRHDSASCDHLEGSNHMHDSQARGHACPHILPVSTLEAVSPSAILHVIYSFCMCAAQYA